MEKRRAYERAMQARENQQHNEEAFFRAEVIFDLFDGGDRGPFYFFGDYENRFLVQKHLDSKIAVFGLCSKMYEDENSNPYLMIE